MITKTKPSPTQERTIVQIPLEKIHPHPDNRKMTNEDCKELAESLKAEGLLQPILVRECPWPEKMPIGHYQIIFGERRWRAAKLAGWTEISAEVGVGISDADALRLMNVENAKRKDLNPIEQAEALQKLNHAGFSREEAGAIYGLKTAPAVTNKMRLLQLPDVWRARVASSELPETFARELLPYVEAREVMAVIDKEYRKARASKLEWERAEIETRDSFCGFVEQVVESNTRSLAPVAKSYSRWQRGAKFKITDELRKRLNVVKIPIKGKPTEVAQNCKLFDDLQDEVTLKNQAKRDAKAEKKQAAEAKAARTPAELKRLAEKHAEQLERRIADWRQDWIRAYLADKCLRPGDWQVDKLLLWAATRRPRFYYFSSDAFDRALKRCHVTVVNKLDEWNAEFSAIGVTRDAFANVAACFVREIVWPKDDTPEGLDRELVDGLAADYGVDLDKLWRADQQNEAAREVLQRFFELHNREQLNVLAEELNVPLSAAKTKAAAVQFFLTAMKTRDLPLPKSIAPINQQKARKRKGTR